MRTPRLIEYLACIFGGACSMLAEDAIKAAVKDLQKKRGGIQQQA